MYRNFSEDCDDVESRFLKTMVSVPNTIEIKIQDRYIYIIGALGTLNHKLHALVYARLNSVNLLEIYVKHYNINHKALIGTTRSLIKGMIIGVTSGFIKKLQLIGIGYRVSIQDNVLNFVVGLSHTINYKLPQGISAQCLNQNEIILKSSNKQLIGQVAADLRSIRPPEPFKGKGIRYDDEIVYNKDAKKR